ncbi:nuclear transport factor 2 family protein [Tenacibaculum agarivorans]|uniref:nuclear transport factor 2 family protein n=1 Tax=Tenacibaculum agarivorans TaxID=1908389 RepID=UPI0009FAC2F3|nr:nuclear transport factor 2 family protein [Tenacibaculum agarivorans]
MKIKAIVVSLLCTIASQHLKSQEMRSEIINETQRIQETISKLFIHSDDRNWKIVESLFADTVTLDYSSMTGNSAAKVSPTDITSAWKTVLPGFTYTHHQLGNFITEINESKAHTFCYGTATHYLENNNGNIWTVVGSYDFDLEKINNNWKITLMKFNYKYQNGNDKLIQEAIKNVKSN